MICIYSTTAVAHIHAQPNVEPVLDSSSSTAPSLDGAIETTSSDPKASSSTRLLDQVPHILEALPSWLPPQSDQVRIPLQGRTQADTTIDRQHAKLQQQLNTYVNKVDQWFDTSTDSQDAKAQVRVLLDSQWNPHDGYHFKPRIRGRIELPSLKRRFSLVFGDDSLDNEPHRSVAVNNESRLDTIEKAFDRTQTTRDNSSLALRWERWKTPLGFQLNADLGIRDGNDVYLRLKGQRDWSLGNDFYTHVEQIYRYGSKSEHYIRTNAEIKYSKPSQALLANQASLTGIYQGDQHDWYWDERIFRQHQFFYQHQLSYGWYAGGHVANHLAPLSSYGPFISWRQPIWREWLFIHSELDYFNNKTLSRSHNPSALIRLESWF